MMQPLTVAVLAFLASVSNSYVLRLNVPEVVVHDRSLLYSRDEQPRVRSDDSLPPDLLDEKYKEAEKETRDQAAKVSKQKAKNGKHYEENTENLSHLLKDKPSPYRDSIAKKSKGKRKRKHSKKGKRHKKVLGQSQESTKPKSFWFSYDDDKKLDNTRLPLVDKEQNVENRFMMGTTLDSFETGANGLARSNVDAQKGNKSEGSIDKSNKNSSAVDRSKKQKSVQTGVYLNQKEKQNEVLKKSSSRDNVVNSTEKGSIVDEEDGISADGATKEILAKPEANNEEKGKDSKNGAMNDATEFSKGEKGITVKTSGSTEGKNQTKGKEKQEEFNVKEDDIDNVETYDSATEEEIHVNKTSADNLGKNTAEEKNGLNEKGVEFNDLQSALTDKGSESEAGADKEATKVFSGDKSIDQSHSEKDNSIDDNEYVDSTTEEIIDLADSNNAEDNEVQTDKKEDDKEDYNEPDGPENGSEATDNAKEEQFDSANTKNDSSIGVNSTSNSNNTAKSVQRHQLEGVDLGEFTTTSNRNSITTAGKVTSAEKEGANGSENQPETENEDEFNTKPTPPVTLLVEGDKADEFSNSEAVENGTSVASSSEGASSNNQSEKPEFSETKGGAGQDEFLGKNNNFQEGSAEFQETPKTGTSVAEGDEFKNVNQGEKSEGQVKQTEKKPVSGLFDEIEKEKNKLLSQVEGVLNTEIKENKELSSFVDKETKDDLAEKEGSSKNEFNEQDDNQMASGNEGTDGSNLTQTFSGKEEKPGAKENKPTSNEQQRPENSNVEAYQLKSDNNNYNDNEFGNNIDDKKAGEDLNGNNETNSEFSAKNGDASSKSILATRQSGATETNGTPETWKVGPEILPKSEFGDQAEDGDASKQPEFETRHDGIASDSSNLVAKANDDVANNGNNIAASGDITAAKQLMKDNSKKIKNEFDEMKDTVFKPDYDMSVVNSKLNIAQQLYNYA